MNRAQKEAINHPEWQVLRESLLGTWKRTPRDNVKRLINFIMHAPYVDEMDVRARIVHNYLTGSGFRSGTISHPAIDACRSFVKGMMEGAKRRP